tara:strand:+ start:2402 stop:5188 length:2787 start_codon:yes stop_codon:yes gene_type:complete
MSSLQDETIRVAASQVRALANVHPGVCGAVKEVYANAEGYHSPSVNPYCNAVLVNEDDPRKAFIFFQSHSLVTVESSEHVLDLGHLQDAVAMSHRKFNVGTYIVSGKLCVEGKEGMIVISFDPATREGLVMRAYISAEGYVCKVQPVKITLDKTGTPSLFATASSPTERNRIEMLWLGTQWEKGEFNQGASHRDFCKMLWETTVKHAMGADTNDNKTYQTTTFLYCDLKTIVLEGKTEPECFLRSTANDILERRSDGTTGNGFRVTIREHFMPAVLRMPLVPSTEKKRDFSVMGKSIALTASGKEDAPWISRIASKVNTTPRTGETEWYVVCKDTASECYFKPTNVTMAAKLMKQNWEKGSRSLTGINNAEPVGIVVVHGDKVLSKGAFDFHTGKVFQVTPEAANGYEPLVTGVMRKGEPTHTDADALWVILGVPNAKREMDMSLTQAERDAQRLINAAVLGVDDSGLFGYEWLLRNIVRPFRKARKKVDLEGALKTTGVFKIEDFVDNTRGIVNYMTKVAVERDRQGEGALADDVDHGDRAHYATLFGLGQAGILQVGNCEQPMDKERLLDGSVDCRRLHKEVMRVVVHHDLKYPTPYVKAKRDGYQLKWQEVLEDAKEEDAKVQQIQDLYRIRVLQAEKEKHDQQQELARKAADEKARREAAEAKAADAERRASSRLEQKEKDLEQKEARVRKQAEQLKAKQAADKEKKAADDLVKKETNALKAKARQLRGKAAQTQFATNVAAFTEQWGFPDGMRIASNDIKPSGDIFSRSKAMKDVTRINEGHQVVEAIGYAFKPNSLFCGNKRELEDWVTGDMAKAMLKAAMEDEAVIKSLGLEFNFEFSKPPPLPPPYGAPSSGGGNAAGKRPMQPPTWRMAKPPVLKKQRGESSAESSPVVLPPSFIEDVDGADDVEDEQEDEAVEGIMEV